MISSRDSLRHLRRGFDELAALLALTLGPTQGTIFCTGSARNTVEILTDSGTIARRVIALPDRQADVGAMLLRNMVWGVHEQYGDGAATAAVLAQAIVRESARMIAAGANPMLLRRGIERGVEAAVTALNTQAVSISGQAALTRIAQSVTGDHELSKILGEMFDMLGADAAIEIEEYAAPYLNHDYLDGGRWRARPAARVFLPEGKPELILENPLVLVADEKIERVDMIRRLLERVVGEFKKRPLLIVAPGISGEALNALSMNHARGTLTIGAAVITTSGANQDDDLQDLAVLTGSVLLSRQRGQHGDFGQARRVILTRDTLTIIGGAGDSPAKQARITALHGQMMRIKQDRERLRMRIGRLTGGVGIVRIGAHTKRERDMRKEQAKKALLVLESALTEGVLPGGGTAYLDCIPAVLAAHKGCDGDIAFGIGAVASALEAPFCQLVHNHGHVAPQVALNAVKKMGVGHGFDTLTGNYACMAEVGVMDSVRVLRGVLTAAASTAIMAITTEVIILHADHNRPAQVKP